MNKDKIISNLRNYTKNVEMKNKGAIVRFIKNNLAELDDLYSLMTFKEIIVILKNDLNLEINYKYFLNVYNKLKKSNLSTENPTQITQKDPIKTDHSTPVEKRNGVESNRGISDMEIYYLMEGKEVKNLLKKYDLFDDVNLKKKLFKKKVTADDLKKHCGFDESKIKTPHYTAVLGVNIHQYLNKI